ncbi:MAG: VWA-like domain-containing protein [Thermofilaceae archaeon]
MNKDLIIRHYQAARVKAVSKSSFFVHSALFLEPVVDDKVTAEMQTMCTDGRKIYIHPQFIDKLYELYGQSALDFLASAVAHETLHCCLNHPDRIPALIAYAKMKGYDLPPEVTHTLACMACDCVVNEFLSAMGFAIDHKRWITLKKLKEVSGNEHLTISSTEEIFDALLQSYAQFAKRTSNPSLAVNELSKAVGRSFDMHMPWADKADEAESKRPQTPKEGGGPGSDRLEKEKASSPPTGGRQEENQETKKASPAPTGAKKLEEGLDRSTEGEGEEVGESLAEKWRKRAAKAAAVAEKQLKSMKQHGYLPAELETVLGSISGSKVLLSSLLHRFITQRITVEANWNRPAIHYLAQDVYLPTHKNKKLKIAVALDTSGSISDREAKEMLGILKTTLFGLKDLISEVRYLECDAEVHKDVICKSLSDLPWDHFSIVGRGGTDFRPVFDKLESERYRPDVLIYFTDGMGTYPDKPPRYPVVWVIPREGRKPDFGMWVVVDLSSQRVESVQNAGLTPRP